MQLRGLDPQRPRLQEPVGNRGHVHARLARQDLGGSHRGLVDVGALGDAHHRGPGYQPRVLVADPHAVALHGSAQLAVQAPVHQLPPTLEHVVDGPAVQRAGTAVEQVPGHPQHHRRPGQQQRCRAQLDDQVDVDDDPGQLQVGEQRGGEPRRVGGDARRPQHQHRRVHQGQRQQHEGAGHLGDGGHVQGQDHRGHPHPGQRHAPRRGVEPVEPSEPLAHQPVAAHGQRVAGRGQDPGVGGRRERGQRGQHHQHRARGGHHLYRGGVDRSQVVVQLRRRDHRHRHQHPQRVQGGAHQQRQRHSQRDVAGRIVDLLGCAGHLGQTPVGHEHEPDHAHQSARPIGEEGVQAAAAARAGPAHAGHHEPAHHGQHESHQQHLHQGAGPGAQDVDDGETGDQHDGQRLGRHVEHEVEVGAHPDQGEGVLEHQREPGGHARDGPDRRAVGPHQEVVGTPGAGHGRGQLGHAQHGRNRHNPGQGVGQHRAGAGLGRGQARQQEQARAEHRPRTQHEHMAKSQRAGQPAQWPAARPLRAALVHVPLAARAISKPNPARLAHSNTAPARPCDPRQQPRQQPPAAPLQHQPAAPPATPAGG